LGLVGQLKEDRVVSGASLLPEALAFAEVLAAKPPLTVSAALAAIHRLFPSNPDFYAVLHPQDLSP